eukprot:359211-Chlamydomonas_euryale.AAC.9
MLLYPEVGLCSHEVPESQRQHYEADAAKYWDRFYARNADRFYKDRHYFDREFPELASGAHVLLEVRAETCWSPCVGACTHAHA